jgi:hypothetical protein
MRPPRHRPPPRFHAALGYVATADFVFGGAGLAVALGLTFAPQTHVRPLTPAEITSAAPPTVTPSAVSTVVAIDDGKNGPEPTTASRACRCSPRTPPAVVGAPTVTTPPLTALSAPRTASTTQSRARTSTAPGTTQGDPLTVSTTPPPTSAPTTAETVPTTGTETSLSTVIPTPSVDLDE